MAGRVLHAGERVDGLDAQPGAQPVHMVQDLAAQRPLAGSATIADPGLEQVGQLILQLVRLVEVGGEF